MREGGREGGRTVKLCVHESKNFTGGYVPIYITIRLTPLVAWWVC